MARGFGVVVLLAALLAVEACQPPDCDHVDCGTCGNACCILNVTFPLSATDLYSKMVGNLKSGGDDGRYTFIGSENMTQYNLSAKYIIQVL
jgi:hypothetical protein